jgi:hypothetical protein
MEKERGRNGVFRKRPVQLADTATVKRKPRWGQPAPCPACRALGVLLHVDPVEVVMHLRCRVCRAEWQLCEADVENAPDPAQRDRARALKEEEEAVRNARLAAAEVEAGWQQFREKVEPEGLEESR